jgi:hypothetical protein
MTHPTLVPTLLGLLVCHHAIMSLKLIITAIVKFPRALFSRVSFQKSNWTHHSLWG